MRPIPALSLLLCTAALCSACGQWPARSVRSEPVVAANTAEPAAQKADAETDIPVRKQGLQQTALAMDASAAGYFMDVQQARLQQVAGEQLSLQREPERIIIRLPGPLNFEIGRARLSDPGQGALRQVAAILAEFRASLIAVHGHTDDTGSAEGNLRLSQQRAQSVANVLRLAGVDAQRILVIGHGANKPLTPNIDQASREQNRRVELVIEPIVKSQG
ncbi:OmpA family protein [Pseudomarimonas arenosa]|uniref:OmpA family protein n=1 Tax=Pseudomarimonas arenosa TaxID=2774145 RepID=A0AAW3ZVQ9_9GAMM|nr:OmpA family protein [Pseudomarimonas arenosa]MBD8528141.1 OmpA family protein [Pseudomarimonas arenosa]